LCRAWTRNERMKQRAVRMTMERAKRNFLPIISEADDLEATRTILLRSVSKAKGERDWRECIAFYDQRNN
jgi:hypothetical protein